MTGASFVDVKACWVCGGGSLTRIHDALLDLNLYREQHPALADYTGETVWFCRCAGCGFTQPERLPSIDGFFDRLYDQLWSPDWVATEFESAYKDLIFQRVLTGLARRPQAGRRLLDIGAHAGRFMHLAATAGWRPEGIELNPRTAAFAAAKTGFSVQSANVHALALAESSYGAVTLIDVLEHVPHPVELLFRVRAALQPGGWLIVKVPSGPAQQRKERLRAWLFRGYRPRLADNLVHVNHFSPESLRLALDRSGFEDVALELAPPELPEPYGVGAVCSNVSRRILYAAGCLLPGGIHSPLALNLLAFARRAA